jgi:DNA-directed RNA polymerase specialized sigma24 family protein
MRHIDEDAARNAASRLLEVAASGEAGAALNEPLEALLAHVDKEIGAVHSIWSGGRGAPLDREDLRQIVLERLVKSPPSSPGQKDPLVTVLGWVKRTANNALTDAYRRASFQNEEGTRSARFSSIEQVTGAPDGSAAEGASANPRAELELSQRGPRDPRTDVATLVEREDRAHEIAAYECYLAKVYSKGAVYLAALEEDGGEATGNERAERMGISRANYDQIARRTRIKLSEFIALRRREKTR